MRIGVATGACGRWITANFLMLASLVAFPLTWGGWGSAWPGGAAPPMARRLHGGTTHRSGRRDPVGADPDVRTARLQWRRTVRQADLLADLRAERATLVQAVQRR